MDSRFDAALVILATFLGSALVHAGLLAALSSGLRIVVEDRIEFTLVTADDVLQVAVDVDETIDLALADESDSDSAVSETASSTGNGPNGTGTARPTWRGRMRALEDAHNRKVALVADRMARLAAHRPFVVDKNAAPPPVVRCGITRRTDVVDVRPVKRDLGRLVPIMPRGVLPLAYIERIGEMSRRRVGESWVFDLVLPADRTGIAFDDPAGVVVAVGRTDARCVVTVEVTKNLFPMRLKNVPVAVVDETGVTLEDVVDVAVTVDAVIILLHSTTGRFPFSEGALGRQEKLKETLLDHASSFVAVRALAEYLSGGDE